MRIKSVINPSALNSHSGYVVMAEEEKSEFESKTEQEDMSFILSGTPWLDLIKQIGSTAKNFILQESVYLHGSCLVQHCHNFFHIFSL